jgi:hypothetical protein
MSQIFEDKLKEIGIVLTDTQKEQFFKFYENKCGVFRFKFV